MRLVEGAAGLGLALDAQQESLLELFVDLLVEQNETLNLTSLRDPDDVRRHLVLDALAAVPLFPASGSVIDVGTGGGVPGLPLAIVAPHLAFTLVDAREKKVAFVRRAVARLGLRNVAVRAGRAEDLGRELRESFDVGLAKALAPLAVLTELMIPLLRPGGLLIAWKGPAAADEIARADNALKELGAEVEERRPYAIPGGDEHRELVLVRRVGPLSARYPRRAGTPEKRPL